MLIVKEELRIFNSIMISFHAFDSAEKFDEYKEQMTALDFGTSRIRTYAEVHKSVAKELTLDAFKDTTLENFMKIMGIVKSA